MRILVHEYAGGRLAFFHLDLYRIAGPGEALRFGIEEYLGAAGTVALVEWPERAEGLFPPGTEHWEIELVSDGSRRILARS